MSVDQKKVMLLFDDEVPEPQAEQLRARLEKDPEARALFDNFEQIGELVRQVSQERAEQAPDLVDAILAQTSETPARGPARSRRVSRVAWRRSLPAAGVGLALAAALALVVRTVRHERSIAHPPAAASALAEAPPAPSSALAREVSPAPQSAGPAADRVTPQVSIETVDFGGNNGAIFMVSAGDGATPVVWLSDKSASDRARMKRL